MKTVTVDDVLTWDLCPHYSEAKIRKLSFGRERWSALDMIDELPGRGVPITDILWLVLREELIDPAILRLFARNCAERVGMEAGAEIWQRAEDAARWAAWTVGLKAENATRRWAERKWQLAHLREMLAGAGI